MPDRLAEEFEAFVNRCRHALSQQVAGRTQAFQDLWSHDSDVVLMGAAGSYAVGWSAVSEALAWASSHLDYGNWHHDNLMSVVDGDHGFTLDLEHMSHVVEDQTVERTLRASQGYRRMDGEWRVIFRHGDPMAEH